MRNESYSKYYPVIKEFIHKISKYESFNPVIEFEKAFKSINLKSDKHIGETWKILSYLTTERYDSSDSSKIKQVSKLKFSREYQAATVEDHQSLMSIQSRMNLNQASLAYLHSDFIELIKEFVNQKIIYCELGGNPTINDFIKAFIKLKFRTLKMRSGGYEVYESPKTYFWTHLYYLFRCGLYKDCSDYCYMSASLNFNESEKYILECFITFLNRDDKFLPNSFRIKLQDIYNTVEKVSDPYKYTICKIIGRFDIRDVYVPEVTETFYDFLWAKFNIFQEDLKLTPLKENQHMLSDIQNEIHNEGAENIISGRCSPIEYVNILLLTHQFEAAIAYLLTDSQFHSEALHIFTSLCYYGLIRVSDLTDPVGWDYFEFNCQ
ncbi:NIC-domain-containing protein [Neoconidiobolus thromboides FSU 785]|nr:NIC-domain-containing protein [Neoconidiobolus thromboides FSU 785]